MSANAQQGYQTLRATGPITGRGRGSGCTTIDARERVQVSAQYRVLYNSPAYFFDSVGPFFVPALLSTVPRAPALVEPSMLTMFSRPAAPLPVPSSLNRLAWDPFGTSWRKRRERKAFERIREWDCLELACRRTYQKHIRWCACRQCVVQLFRLSMRGTEVVSLSLISFFFFP